MSAGHQPVMRDEVVALLGLPHYERLVDGTVGYEIGRASCRERV